MYSGFFTRETGVGEAGRGQPDFPAENGAARSCKGHGRKAEQTIQRCLLQLFFLFFN